MLVEYPKFNILAVLVFTIVILIAHICSVAGYDWRMNTVSDLGSQGYPRKWIMQVGFILFGLILCAGIFRKFSMHTIDYATDIPMGLYGLGILISGICCTEPFVDGVKYSAIESSIHSASATFAGIAFSMAILFSGLKAEESAMRWIHFIFLGFVLGMSIYFGLSRSNNGLIQKLMYAGSFIWIIKFYTP